jgi:hypothetical protein
MFLARRSFLESGRSIEWREHHIVKLPRIPNLCNRLISVNGPLLQTVRILRMERPILVKTHAARLHLGNIPHTAAKAGTTGCARAFRRAFDWQQRGRSGSAVWRPELRRCAQGARFRQWSARRPFRPNIRRERGNRQTERRVQAPTSTDCSRVSS